MRYFPMILAAGLLSAGLLAGSGPAHRHAHARVGSFRCRGHVGREGWLLLPPPLLQTLLLWLWTLLSALLRLRYRRPYGYGYRYGRRWRY